MKPYYQDADVTLYHGDCREVRLTPGSVDLLLADPPYGVNWQSGLRQQAFDLIANDGGTFPLLDVLGGLLPALKRGRHLYVFGLEDFGTLPVAASTELIWDKEMTGPGDLALPWGPGHERILLGCYKISKANRDDGYGRLAARLRRHSVIRCPRINAAAVTRHPTEKPVPLLRELIESSSSMGELVFDPYAGSGSTLVAAKLEGRRAIGIELDERYCAVAAERLAQQVLPLAV
jgi:site-specific DNA-methyltransferase (adenine-specific)